MSTRRPTVVPQLNSSARARAFALLAPSLRLRICCTASLHCTSESPAHRPAPPKISPIAPLFAATTGVPQANDSRAANTKVSIGPGAKRMSTDAIIRATTARSAINPRKVTGNPAAARSSSPLSGPSPMMTKWALIPLRRNSRATSIARLGFFSRERRLQSS